MHITDYASPQNENESEKLEKLKELVEKQTTFVIPTTEWYLLSFLRYTKGDVDSAFKKLLSKWKEREKLSSFFDDLYPSHWEKVLMSEFTVPFIHRVDGMQVLYVRACHFDATRFSLIDIFKNVYFSLCTISRREETQIYGITLIVDLAGFSMAHVKACNPFDLKLVIDLFQGFPLQIKGIHFVNEPGIFQLIYGFIKMFMKPKLRERIQFHGGDFKGSLHKYFGPTILPKEYGGGLELEEALESGFVQNILKDDQYFKDFYDKSKFGYRGKSQA